MKGLSNQQQQMQADILFTFFNTEAWSFSGSQRFARDISQPFQCTEKCDSDECCNRPPRVSLDFQNIKLKNTLAFIELGQLGSLNSSLTAHSAMSATGDLDSLISLVQQALPSGSDIQLTRSSLAGQQLPPSSVQSFLTYNQSLAHIVLADHDQHYKNPYFNSPYDDGSRLNESALRGRLCDLSTAVAKSVYGMAMSGSVPNSGAIVPSAVQSNCSLIAELWQCLMQNFSCPLVAQTLGNRTIHYIYSYYFT
jgi:hypothetical protein